MIWLVVLLSAIIVLLGGISSVLYWYNKKIVGQWIVMVEDVKTMQVLAGEYEGHLEVVFAMDSYTGEPIIENMLKHAKAFSKDLKTFQESYAFDSDSAGSPPQMEEAPEDEENEEEINR